MSHFNAQLLKEAIEDAKAVRAQALANASQALNNAFNVPVEYTAKAWIGKNATHRLFPTERTKPLFQKAIDDFKGALPASTMFNIGDVPCKLLDIALQMDFERTLAPLLVKLSIARDSVNTLSERWLLLGSLYLSGEAEIDETLPDGGFTNKDWILLNKVCYLRFTELYWETHDTGTFTRRRMTLASLDNLKS